MVRIVVSDATVSHTGTTVVGAVAGTVTVGSNSFVKIEGNLIMDESGTLVVPSHEYNLVPPLFHSHSFTPNTFAQSFVTIENKKIVLLGDSYSGDLTTIDSVGSNSFVDIS
jgi:hypothetical protein